MTEPFPDRLRLTLSVRVQQGRVPEPVRVKRLLKMLLRQYGIVCDDIRPIDDSSADCDGASRSDV